MSNEIVAGCTVHHGPTDEDWFILGVDRRAGKVCVAGWPQTIGLISDCTFKEKGDGITDSEREHRRKAFGEGWE